jgi:hypothetical protein
MVAGILLVLLRAASRAVSGPRAERPFDGISGPVETIYTQPRLCSIIKPVLTDRLVHLTAVARIRLLIGKSCLTLGGQSFTLVS